ncbi:hypothetical protein, partial [Nocardia sp. NPDC046763]|uniref:hypothetical protein n=1 Tax=Nocardia sp. NPDC046763 TaxID=3155256 RepID=UPI0033E99A6E
GRPAATSRPKPAGMRAFDTQTNPKPDRWIEANMYALTGIHHDRLQLTVPFEIDIDLTEIDHL